jgi:hypothetical protein
MERNSEDVEIPLTGPGITGNGLVPRNQSLTSTYSDTWILGNRRFPRSEIVFFWQISIIAIVVIASIVNLSIGSKSDIWLVLLSTGLGAVLPNPNIKKHHNNLKPVSKEMRDNNARENEQK